ncbi:MAG: hypothetical protein P8J87_07115 [Verrucomicrobiales bacterium]|nr:hypothetical protein [Verrucomicrobiales bacterium]
MSVAWRPHLEGIEPCPYLPLPDGVVRAEATRRFRGGVLGEAFYEAALNYAQSLWLQGFPAKSLLLINRAMGAALGGDEEIVRRWPMPYEAAAWVMVNRREEDFIGNPRRHYQHLATRMVAPRKELRSWRAWGCRVLSDLVFDHGVFPEDTKQIREEGTTIPGRDEVVERLGEIGLKTEVNALLRAEELARRG